MRAKPVFDMADFDELCARHPDEATALRELLAGTHGPPPHAVPGATGEATGELRERLLRLSRPIARGERYARASELGHGGTGMVTRVQDLELNRWLALKELAAGNPLHHPLAAARFLEEAHVTAQLDHPGIVPLHELGIDASGRLFFIMKLVQGQDLRQILAQRAEGRGDWSQTRLLGVLLRVCEAMAYAHSKGVIHRDLKPGNVMVGHFGEVYVMDWGLARVMGRQDLHDIRLKSGLATESLHTERREEREASPDSPLVTMDGVVLGTPAYMPPEQAGGEVSLVSARSDVYSIGAILYHVLAGEPPYFHGNARMSAHAMLARVLEGPPLPLASLAPRAPAELVAICERAMARDPSLRYADTMALGEELRAFLEHRVVSAYRTGPVVELKKWVQRNRALAATAILGTAGLVGGLVVALVAQRRSEHSAVQAMEASRVAERRGEDVLRLAAFQRLEDLKREEPLLWPPLPRFVPQYDAWLERARTLVAELEPRPGGYQGHRAKLAELEARARPPAAEEIERVKREHPRHAELQALQEALASLDLRLAARAGRAPSDGAPEDGASAAVLLERAWPRVDPDRVVFGEEGRGLALAELAFDRIEGDAQFVEASRVLAWALFANGQDTPAFQKLDAALRLAPEELRQPLATARRRLAAEIVALEAVPHVRAELVARVQALEEAIAADTRLAFSSPEDEWWHRQLARLTKELEELASDCRGARGRPWTVEQRRAFAATITERSLTGTDASRRWAEACASIADERACPPYRGLRLEPQLGLLPIGRDPDSKLWEFAHLMSGNPPARGADGRLVLQEDSAIVLVLLPGGTFTMGAQADDPDAPNYDEWAEPIEGPPHEVQLSPFFLSKYEVTQGQWLRLTGTNPSQDNPETYQPEWNAEGRPGTLLMPVEQVSWNECVEACAKLSLALPSEAQWEYAARAGRHTRWWSGDDPESAAGTLNVADKRVIGTSLAPAYDAWLDDGQVSHAEVGRYRANPFGLHDILGNVWEWCGDGYDGAYYLRSPHLDPENDPLMSPLRPARGGGFTDPLRKARVSQRVDGLPDRRDLFLGLRPVRKLESAAR